MLLRNEELSNFISLVKESSGVDASAQGKKWCNTRMGTHERDHSSSQQDLHESVIELSKNELPQRGT